MNSEKKQSTYKIIMLVVITALITFLITTVFMYQMVGDNSNNTISNITGKNKEQRLINTLDQFKTLLEKKYIGDVDEDKLIQGAMKGFIDGLGDPYTTYLPKADMASLEEEADGKYVGIGVYVGNNTKDNTIVVAQVMNDTPAQKAGLQEGDIILSIDGVTYTGEQLSEASSKLKGEEGTKTVIKINRAGEEKKIEIVRESIHVSRVSSEMLEDNIGYIQIESFDGGVAKEFEEQLIQLKNKNMRSLVIDMRSNGGGVVEEALGIAELFSKKGDALLITKSKSTNDVVRRSEKEPIVTNLSVAILVNEGSASATEILAGALRDNIGAKLVGKKTYGKGVIQTVYRLSDGSGIKVTTDEYYTPKHNKINKVGLSPDVEISLTKNEKGEWEISRDTDVQLKKAIEILK